MGHDLERQQEVWFHFSSRKTVIITVQTPHTVVKWHRLNTCCPTQAITLNDVANEGVTLE